MKKIFKAKAQKGQIVVEEPREYSLLLWSLNDKDLEVTIAKPTRKRSNPQNGYYHGVVLKLLSDYTGYTQSEMHDAMRIKFLTEHGNFCDTIKSTTSLTTMQFEDYMSQIRTWASSELSVYIPEPNEIAMT